MIEAELPDGTVLEFPDGTPDTVIQQAVKKHIGGPANRLENYTNAVTGKLTKIGTGIIGAGADIADATGLIAPETAQTVKQAASAGREQFIAENPTRPGIERWIGDNVTGNPLAWIGGNPVTAGALSGGGEMLAETDPAAPASTKAINTTLGAGTGGAAGWMLNKLLSPAKVDLTPEQQRLAQVLQDEGVPLTPAQQTGNRGLSILESGFENLPLTAGKQEAIRQGQLDAFTRAALQKAGINADDASPATLAAAKDAIGKQFEQLSQGTTVNLDNAFLQKLADVDTNYGKTLNSMQRPIFDNYLDDLRRHAVPPDTKTYTPQNLSGAIDEWGNLKELERHLRSTVDDTVRFSNQQGGFWRHKTVTKAAEDARNLDAVKNQIARQENLIREIESAIAKGQTTPPIANMPGEAYQRIRSQLSKQANAIRGSDPYLSEALRGLRVSLDDAANRSIPADKAAAWADARTRYANLKPIMKAMEAAGKDATAGYIPPAALRTALKTGNQTGYVTGKGDLNDLARAGAQFLPKTIGDSGTATRNAMVNALQFGAGVVPGAIVGGAPGAIAGPALTLGLPRLAQSIYNRPGFQNWMLNGVPIMTPERQALAAALAGTGTDALLLGNQ